jgi:hypothetical protein
VSKAGDEDDPDQLELDDPEVRDATLRLSDLIGEIGKAVDEPE